MIPWPQFTTHRPSVITEHRSHDHLPQIRAVILGVPILTQTVPTRSLEVETGCIEERQRELGEEIPPVLEESLFSLVLTVSP